MEGPMALLSFLLLALAGIVAAISLATQAAVNANLGKALDESLLRRSIHSTDLGGG
jgi:uncharacterized membrane protein YdcZ (DUF606 family)